MLESLEQYIEVAVEKYDACLDSINADAGIDGVSTTLRFHHLRFDGNGEPKFADLARCLAEHVITYCLSARRGRPERPDEWAAATYEARRLLRKNLTSGEAGEILLYLLLEAVLRAPQIVAKMDLKTNPRMEVHGSDGIHVKWHREDGCLDLYFGESKLERSLSSALTHAFESIEHFHADGLRDREFGMVTTHYKFADSETKEAVARFVDRQKPGGDCRINHACLIGYDWAAYRKLDGLKLGELEREFKSLYSSDVPRLQRLLAKRFDSCKQRKLRFEIFFLPFRDVQDFREAFLAALD